MEIDPLLQNYPDATSHGVSIIAGNPAVDIIDDNLTFEAQLKSFKKGVALAQQLRKRDIPVTLLVTLDHIKQLNNFAAKDLSIKKNKPQPLSKLSPQIQEIFTSLLKGTDITVEDISFLFEIHARQTAMGLCRSLELDIQSLSHEQKHLLHATKSVETGIKDDGSLYRYERITCNGVFATWYREAAKFSPGGVVLFYYAEGNPRNQKSVMEKGIEIAHDLFDVPETILIEAVSEEVINTNTVHLSCKVKSPQQVQLSDDVYKNLPDAILKRCNFEVKITSVEASKDLRHATIYVHINDEQDKLCTLNQEAESIAYELQSKLTSSGFLCLYFVPTRDMQTCGK